MIKLLIQRLKHEQLNQEDIMHIDIFSIIKKTEKEICLTDPGVLQKINSLVMEYLLDLLVTDEKNIYFEQQFDLKMNRGPDDIKIIREPTPNFQALINKLRKQKMFITHLFKFVQMTNNKLQQMEMINGVLMPKVQSKIKQMLLANLEDQNTFRSLVTVKICKELCPGCQRICGVEQTHTDKHQCLYGHQMRALGGVKLDNGDASVIRCEDVQLMSQIKFNGQLMTWKQFKELWEKRQEGSWIFDDLKKDFNKQLFITAWDITGKAICQRYNMNFVKSNAVNIQKETALAVDPIHYIFALDDSGSMHGSKWNDLMEAFSTAIHRLRVMSQSQQQIKISILVFDQLCTIFQENVSPQLADLNIIPRYGGTNFAKAFSTAYQVMLKYVNSAKIKFIFMTDGEDSYPTKQVKKIKKLQTKYLNKIEYFGIEYRANGDTMKLISQELGGTNSISYQAAALTETYIEIIDRN